MAALDFKLTSSLEKVFFDTEIYAVPELKYGTALRGERYSFQLVWRGINPDQFSKLEMWLKIDSPLGDAVCAQSVESVPVRMPAYNTHKDENYLRYTPGLYPDLLVPVTEDKKLYMLYADTRGIWVDVYVPADQAGGEYPINLKLVDINGNELIAATFTLKVIEALIPEQKTQHTEWFYTDCIADYYRLEVWSEEHWRIIENFMKTAVKNSINMILTPVFTPPLDTAVGGERTTTQLVDVYRDNGKWSFGFDKLGRWIDVCNRCGVKYLEINHMFTQWGAKHAPKVMATVDGEYKKVFGWETDSLGDEYAGFLDAFMPELIKYLNSKGIDENRCVFHVSDEPSINHLEQYRSARAIISKHLEGYRIIDALSNFEFYKTGALDHPVPGNNHIEPFLAAKVPGLWTYYCCSQAVKVSNRFIAMPGARTRILGVQMYKYDIEGFLQWGYNYYNNQYSVAMIDPYAVTDGEYFVPAGDAFAVLPARDGTAYETIHFLHVAQAMQDIRALQLAEELCGREAVLNAIDEGIAPITFSEYPKSAKYMLGLREKINAMIAEKVQ
nr:DUF4091 domain-containing protein [Clostridia bacterium]